MLQPLFFRSTSSRFPTPCRRSFSSGPPSFRRRQVLEIESRWTDGTFSGHYDTLLESHGSFHHRGARVPSTLGKRNILSQTVNLGLIHAAGSSSIQAHTPWRPLTSSAFHGLTRRVLSSWARLHHQDPSRSMSSSWRPRARSHTWSSVRRRPSSPPLGRAGLPEPADRTLFMRYPRVLVVSEG